MSLAFIRPATLQDLETIISFSEKAGIGITSLPRTPELLEAKLAESEKLFHETSSHPLEHLYLFCLEFEGKVLGISGIISRIGTDHPFFVYHLISETRFSSYLQREVTTETLHFIQAQKQPTEIGSLFLSQDFRQKHFGQLLSLSRFLFIANFRKRFSDVVIAEMRGVNRNGYSPFWEAIGRPFFQIEFPQADLLRSTYPKSIEELFPKYPIYPALLSDEAKACIGQVHPETVPAKKILEKQGFRMSQYVDIFDAGPHLFAPTDQIASLKESRTVKLKEIRKTLTTSVSKLMTNTKLQFRACVAECQIENGEAVISQSVANVLGVEIGETLRYYSL